MQFTPIKTRKFLPPQDDLYQLLDEFLPPLKEKDLLFITSKIVSIHQGRCLKITKTTNKNQLITREADGYYKNNVHSLTLKDMTLTPYAGIDRSNAKGHYVLWPKNPHQTAKKIWAYLRKKHKIKHLGLIITDSFCLPLRWGHLGISIGFYGFHPNKSYVGQKDIFGRTIIQANSNLVDGLAGLATVIMGEGNEQTPLLIVRNSQLVKFTTKDTLRELKIPQNQTDFYTPMLKAFEFKK
jgi:F420-0:gamma-glutamyl ligase